MKRTITIRAVENLPRQTLSGAFTKAGYWLTKANNCDDPSQAQQYFDVARFWLVVSNLLQRPLLEELTDKEEQT